MATPLMILIGIHYHTRTPDAGDYGANEGRSAAPAVIDQTRLFVDAGLLIDAPGRSARNYEPTEALAIWIEALCSVPFPVKEWKIPPREPPPDRGYPL